MSNDKFQDDIADRVPKAFSPLGYCPQCGQPGAMRERRPNGNDKCMMGHVYPSADATPRPTAAEQRELWVVGQWVGDGPWHFQGVFSSKKKAIQACRDTTYFMGPVKLDMELPSEEVTWVGLHYPKLQEAGTI